MKKDLTNYLGHVIVTALFLPFLAFYWFIIVGALPLEFLELTSIFLVTFALALVPSLLYNFMILCIKTYKERK